MIESHAGCPLSLVLPVYNGQGTLEDRVAQLFEIASDIQQSFEILIVDDGSTDGTEEVAIELSRLFPQVQVVHHHRRMGIDATTETGTRASRGDFIIVLPESATISASQLQWCWKMRENSSVEQATIETPETRKSLIDRLFDWTSEVVSPPLAIKKFGEGLRCFHRTTVTLPKAVPSPWPSTTRVDKTQAPAMHAPFAPASLLTQIRELTLDK